MKSQHLVFYGANGDAAKARASKIRADGANVQIRQAVAYGGEVEPCDVVEILSDVPAFDRARIETAYGEKVRAAAAPKAKLSLPEPPAPPAPPAPPSRNK